MAFDGITLDALVAMTGARKRTGLPGIAASRRIGRSIHRNDSFFSAGRRFDRVGGTPGVEAALERGRVETQVAELPRRTGAGVGAKIGRTLCGSRPDRDGPVQFRRGVSIE